MKRRLGSFTVSVVVVGLSLGAGFTVRRWLEKTPVAKVPGAIPQIRVPDGTSLSPLPPAAPLTSESPESLQALEKEWRGSWQGGNPFRLQAAVMLRILRGTQSSEDCAAAVAILFKAPQDSTIHPAFTTSVLNVVFERWAALDPAMALTAALKSPGTQSQTNLVPMVMRAWVSADPEAALAFVVAQPEPWRGKSAASFFTEITRRDPALAMTFAAQAGERGLRSDVAELVLGPWAMSNSSAALQWIAEQASPENRYAFAEACIRSASSQLGLAVAAEKLKPLGLSPKEYDTLLWRAISSGLDYSRRQDPGDVLKVILSMKDDAIRRESMRWLALGNLSGEQNQTLLNSLPPGADRENFLYGQARMGIMSLDFDPGKALEKIAAVAPGQQEALWRELGAKWGTNAPVAASQWIAGEPPGPRRDAVAGEFVRSLVRTDPEAALIWSAQLGDEGKRSRRFAELLPQWAAKDPAAASAWVESAAALSEEDRVSLRDVLTKPAKPKN